jgi:hypothetical protein
MLVACCGAAELLRERLLQFGKRRVRVAALDPQSNAFEQFTVETHLTAELWPSEVCGARLWPAAVVLAQLLVHLRQSSGRLVCAAQPLTAWQNRERKDFIPSLDGVAACPEPPRSLHDERRVFEARIGGPWPEQMLQFDAGLAVCELGAGAGLSGIVAATLPGVTHVALTDGNAKLIALARANVARNPGLSARVSCSKYEWGSCADLPSVLAASPDQRGFDLVLGADLLYRFDNKATSVASVVAAAAALLRRHADARLLLVNMVRVFFAYCF